MREKFRVVTKAAIYNTDRTKVVIISMPNDGAYGLPGGHIESGESIEECMSRELYEECGIEIGDLQKATFFFHVTQTR